MKGSLDYIDKKPPKQSHKIIQMFTILDRAELSNYNTGLDFQFSCYLISVVMCIKISASESNLKYSY